MSVLTAQTATGQITGEELLALGDIGPSELIEGRIVAMVPTGSEHGLIELTLGAQLRSFVRAKRLGWVMAGEVGIYIRRHPDTVRAADLAFLSRQRSPELPTGFLEIAPDLVVEILSPNDRWQDVRDKLDDYFSIGVELVWIVEPQRRTVLVYRSATQSIEFGEGEILRGEGVLAGFGVPVSEVFAEIGE